MPASQAEVQKRKALQTRRSAGPFVASLEAVEDRKLMSSLTSVSWSSGGVGHSEVFALGFNNTVSMSKDGGGFVPQGGYLKAISAGLDSAGNPEVYGIGADNAVWVDDNGSGWVSRGGYVTAISASANNTVFAIGGDNAVYVNRGGTAWTGLGGSAKALSAGTDAFGRPEVYAIGTDAAAYVSVNGSGFGKIGGYVTEISGAAMGTVFARGGDVDQVFVSRSSSVALQLHRLHRARQPGVGRGLRPRPSRRPALRQRPAVLPRHGTRGRGGLLAGREPGGGGGP